MDLAILVRSIVSLRSGGSEYPLPLTQCTNHDDDDDAHEILETLGIISQQDIQPDREWIAYDLVVGPLSLSEFLTANPPPRAMENKIVSCFLRMASKRAHDRRFDSDPNLLPIEPYPLPVPDRFASDVQALQNGGYCRILPDGVCWNDRAIEIFHKKHMWIEGQPAIDRETVELSEIWLTMPEVVREHCVRGGEVNPLMLADAMSHFWSNDIGWHEQSYKDSGGAIGATRRLSDSLDVAFRLASMLNSDVGKRTFGVSKFLSANLFLAKHGKIIGAGGFIALIVLCLVGSYCAAIQEPSQIYGSDWSLSEAKKLKVASITLLGCAAVFSWVAWDVIRQLLGSHDKD